MSKIPGPPVGYVDLLDYETTENQKKDQAEGRGFNKTPIRPSSAGECSRALYYQSMVFHKKASYPTEIKDPNVVRLLDLGNPIEHHVIRQFQQHLKMVQVKYRQQVLDFGPIDAVNDKNLSQRLEGSLDFCLVSDEWKCVIDVKSKKDKFSSYRGTKWDEETDKLGRMKSVTKLTETSFWVEDLSAFLAELNDAFFEANFVQLNMYACSDFIRSRGIDHAAIIQYSKNDSRLREVRFKPSQEVFDRTVNKFKNVIKAVDTDDITLAPKDHVLGSMKCAFCPFSKECWNENSLKAWFGTFSKKQWPKDTKRMGVPGREIESLMASYEALAAKDAEKERVEQDILKLMVDSETTKIKTDAGEVYEAKHLKIPYPHFELRRSKA